MQERSSYGDAVFSDVPKDCLGNPVHVGSAYYGHLESKFQKDKNQILAQNLLHPKRIIAAKPSQAVTEYRCHIKYAVRQDLENINSIIKIGLFAPGTHQIIDAASCPTQYASINRVLYDMKQELILNQIKGYHEASHQGDLRYLCVRANHLTDELMVTFVVTSLAQKAVFKQILKNLRLKGHKIASGYLDLNSKVGNHIFGFDTYHLIGKTHLRESLDQLLFEVSPTSFFQINPWQAKDIYLRICELAGPPTARIKTAWDLYGGIGQIGLFLARLGYQVNSIEEVKSAAKDANKNARMNALEHLFESKSGKAEDLTHELLSSDGRPDLIVANPSRRGLDASTLGLIADCIEEGSLFFYLSCNLATMLRDLDVLKKRQNKLLQLEAFDMMPHTEHLEWLGVVKK